MQTTGVERRRAPRASASFPIQLSTHAEASAATLKDISSSGLCCSHAEPVREMTMVRMDLKFPGHKEPQRIDGVVVRCSKRRGEFPPSYEIAVYFAEMSDKTRVVLQEFVGGLAAKTG